MAYQIVWHDNAKEDLRDILNYLLDNWSDEVAEKFNDALFGKLQSLERNPFIGIASRQVISLRKLLIVPQSYLYYTVIKDQIVVMNIVDTRKNPESNF